MSVLGGVKRSCGEKNAVGFTEGFLSSLGLIFEEVFFCFGFLWTSCRNKTYGSIHITARHLVPSSKLRVLSSSNSLFFLYLLAR